MGVRSMPEVTPEERRTFWGEAALTTVAPPPEIDGMPEAMPVGVPMVFVLPMGAREGSSGGMPGMMCP